MRQSLTLNQLAQKLTDDLQSKKDLVAPSRALALVSNGEIKLDAGVHGQFPVSGHAHNQIGEYVGIPAKYYDRMQKDAPDLLVSNVNRWLHDKETGPKKRTVRVLRDRVRAFLSDKYLKVDNYQVAERVLEVFASRGITQEHITHAEVTDSNLYIQATVPGLEGEVKSRQVGDVVRGGVSVKNSEIGLGALVVEEYDYRLWCLNGATHEKLMRKSHLGTKLEEGITWAQDTLRATDDAILLQVRDTIAEAASPDRFQKRLARMNDLTKIEIEGDPNDVIEVLADRYNISQTERGGILKSLIKNGDVSAYGVMQAVTEQAHEANVDRAHELEAAGGKLLELSRDEWKRILVPAK